MVRTAALVAVMATAFAPAAMAGTDDVFGLWLVESKTAIVEVYPCSDKACGKIVWLQEPLDEAGQPKVDKHNPEASLQSRPVCGLEMIGDFTRGDDSWDDGFIYDAAEGDTYSSTMKAEADGTLKVRGYIGVPLFGKSQVWSKAADARGGC